MAVKQTGAFTVTGTGDTDQDTPTITNLSGGGFVVAWEDEQDPEVIQGNVFTSGGEQTDAFTVSGAGDNSQFTPTITDLSGGGFAVAWWDAQLARVFPGPEVIQGNVFTSGGEQTGAFTVSAAGEEPQRDPTITDLSGGGFAVAWQDRQDPFVIQGNVFTSGGEQTGAFTVSGAGDDFQFGPTITDLSGGGFAVAWQDRQPPDVIQGNVFTSGGEQTGAFTVSGAGDEPQRDPTITDLSGGGFAVAWEQSGAIRGNVFTSGGEQTGAFTVSGTGDQVRPTITELSGGGFAVAWSDRQDPDVIQGNVFTSGGAKTGAFTVSGTGDAAQFDPTITDLSGGGFAVAWRDFQNPDVIQGNVFQTGSGDSNEAPTADDDTAATAAGGAVTIDVLANDSDPDGDELSIRDPGDPANGEVEITDGGEIRYSPDSGFSGEDSFTYTVSDSNGGTDTAQATIQVQETADAGDNPPQSEDPNIVVANGESQTLKVPFTSDVRGTAEPETIQVPSGTEVEFGGNTGDRVEFASQLRAFEVSAGGNTLTLTNGDTQATIALNGDVELAFADGAATANISAGEDGIATTLGGQTLGDGFDASAVDLDPASASALAGNDGATNPPQSETANIVVLSGESQTIQMPFAADVRGTAEAETVQVAPGADIQFGGNTGDEVEFTAALGEHTFTQSGNVLTVEGPSGERAEISLNADVEVEFADGSATAALVTEGGISMEIGGESVGPDFDPAAVNLDGDDVSALGVSPNATDGLAG